MAKLFHNFQSWLLKNRQNFTSWFSTDRREEPEPEKTLAELPPQLAQSLVEMVQSLPPHPHDLQAVKEALKAALEPWIAQPESNQNSLVVLSSPIGSVARILSESMEEWSSKSQLPMRMLQWVSRPENPEIIKEKLQKQLGRGTLARESGQKEIVVIPNLGWCFLRCIEGLESIDYLQNLILKDKSRFWVIGSGRVGWKYLNYVNNFQAYCGEDFHLPKLDDEQLEAWLEPIVSKLNINFPNPDSSKKEQNHKNHYFQQLANISQGVSTIALQAFLRSIRYESSGEDTQGIVQAQRPELPDLPRLTADEQYLLYSLLLHGDLSLSNLALSLGDDEAMVQHQVQGLRRRGIIEQKNQFLIVNPLHYPQIKSELDNNNFIIDESE